MWSFWVILQSPTGTTNIAVHQGHVFVRKGWKAVSWNKRGKKTDSEDCCFFSTAEMRETVTLLMRGTLWEVLN